MSDKIWYLQAVYKKKTGEPVYTGLYEQLKGQMKHALHPDRLFEKDFLFLPMCLPGHWALAVVCRPLDLVQKLLGRPEISVESGASGANHCVAAVEPCIIFVDSLGSRGKVWCTALAHLLVQARQASSEEEATHGTQVPAWSCEHEHVPRPNLAAPRQTNSHSCGDNMLVATRAFCRDVVCPSFERGDKVETITIQRLEKIITPTWYTADEVGGERLQIRQVVDSLERNDSSIRPDQAGVNSNQDTGELEMKHLQEERERNRRLREMVQNCLESFRGPNNTSESSVSTVTVQEVVFFSL